MRKFIRHPADIPIEVSPVDREDGAPPRMLNVGIGGLAFRVRSAFRPAAVVTVRIPWVQPPFETTARVAWSIVSSKTMPWPP